MPVFPLGAHVDGDGVLRGTIANAGTATSPACRLLGGGSSFSPDEVALGHAGLGLTAGETATLYAIFLNRRGVQWP